MYLTACKYPKSRQLILRQTRASLAESALATFENLVLPENSPVKAGPHRRFRHSYKFPNGSEIVVGGLDDPVKVMSTEYDRIYINEAIEVSEDAWQDLLTRLRNNRAGYHQIFGDTNPGGPMHWIKRRSQDSLRLYSSAHTDNPFLFDQSKGEWTPQGAEYMETLQLLTGWKRERLLIGLWVAAEGSRWPSLSPEVHQFRMRQTFPQGLPVGWRIIMGVDYGKRAPYAALWIAVAPDKSSLYVFREDYQTMLAPDEQARRMRALTAQNERVSIVRADPAIWSQPPSLTTNERLLSVADYYREQFEQDQRFGGLVPGYNKSRAIALATIDVLLNRGNGHPDLYIEEGCTNLWRELTEAVWDARGFTSDKKEDIDPTCADHAITALYYALHAEINPTEEGVRPLPTPEEVRLARLKEINDYDNRRLRDLERGRRSRI